MKTNANNQNTGIETVKVGKHEVTIWAELENLFGAHLDLDANIENGTAAPVARYFEDANKNKVIAVGHRAVRACVRLGKEIKLVRCPAWVKDGETALQYRIAEQSTSKQVDDKTRNEAIFKTYNLLTDERVNKLYQGECTDCTSSLETSDNIAEKVGNLFGRQKRQIYNIIKRQRIEHGLIEYVRREKTELEIHNQHVEVVKRDIGKLNTVIIDSNVELVTKLENIDALIAELEDTKKIVAKTHAERNTAVVSMPIVPVENKYGVCYHGDCIEAMKLIQANTVRLVLADFPYGTTKCRWDQKISFIRTWKELNRVNMDNAATLLFGAEPFSSEVRLSNREDHRYDWYWEKSHSPNRQAANDQPHQVIETISVFYRHQPVYNPQKYLNPKGDQTRSRLSSRQYRRSKHEQELTGIYNEPVVRHCDMVGKRYEGDKLLPANIVYFPQPHLDREHETQKPTDLLEYLINTYTNPGDIVLDCTMGSGSTCIAAINCGRRYIGIEKDQVIFENALRLIREAEVAVVPAISTDGAKLTE